MSLSELLMNSANTKKRPNVNPHFQRAKFLATYRRYQQWSFPDSVIYYISKNSSSPKCYEKMIQTCKYFFVKNPILIVSRLTRDHLNDIWNHYINGKHVNLINVSSKFWITNELFIRNKAKTKIYHAAYSIASKIYQCDVRKLTLWDTKISFNDLKVFAAKCEIILFDKAAVKYENGTVVVLEKIIDILPRVKIIRFDFGNKAANIITSTTVQELLKIPHFLNHIRLSLSGVPETFEINRFYGYIKKNKKTRIYLNFSIQISVAYKIRLQTIVNEIIGTVNRNYKTPYICFPGNDQPSENKLWELYYHKK